MAECIGIYPAWARDDNGARQQWETYRDKFNSLSIPGVPKTGSLSEPFQAAPTVTFIRIEDGQPLSLKPTDSSADLSAEGKDMAQEFRRSITNQINHILGISGTGTVTYEYTPRLTSESANKSSYEEGLYLGIGKPRVEGKELDIIGSHPEMNRVTGRPADGLMGKEWTTQLLAFTVKIELMLSKQ
ncbi:hypothetical protein BDP27DRAFT_1368206 [Rhodocollybia butyracea]|uniref:Uncharacterized protein n=1 Tax=Rhodocollybia butyracea TaxID=206335 RepID=A0A9P5U1T7_9AGAR|nr:hypothetical protein BDP27DRAFT_1368206 [Rhodocollybia butyracea]